MCLGLGNGCVPKEEKVSLLKLYTNNDKLNEMSIEHKAEIIDECGNFNCKFCKFHYEDNCNSDCKQGFKLWLESEAEE